MSANVTLSSAQRSTASSVSANALASRSRVPALRVALSALLRSASIRCVIVASVFSENGDIVLAEVFEGIERRLGVARAGEPAREVARFEPQAGSILVEERLEQPQVRAPALHLRAHPVDRDRIGFGLRFVRGLCQHRARDRDRAMARSAAAGRIPAPRSWVEHAMECGVVDGTKR